MCKEIEKFTVDEQGLLDIFNGKENFTLINKKYDFLYEDHDVWYFIAIVKRDDGKYFRVAYGDTYQSGMFGEDGSYNVFTFEECFPVKTTTIIYD